MFVQAYILLTQRLVMGESDSPDPDPIPNSAVNQELDIGPLTHHFTWWCAAPATPGSHATASATGIVSVSAQKRPF